MIPESTELLGYLEYVSLFVMPCSLDTRTYNHHLHYERKSKTLQTRTSGSIVRNSDH
jgi:hypothetical protein